MKQNDRQRKLGRFRVNIHRAKKSGDDDLVDALERKRAKIKKLPINPDDKTAA
ncbi:MAG: hypothetical protein ACPGJS_00780 [Flammeovirgaceae bacterium]